MYMEKIASFTVDHNKLDRGIYTSRVDGDCYTFDLRMKKPNTGDVLATDAMHAIEHIGATWLRSSRFKDQIIYFGPMGCQTGFYFLFDSRRLSLAGAIALLQQVFRQAAEFSGPMPGKSPVECGNYINLDLETGKAVCRWYADLLDGWTEEQLAYPE